MNILDRIVAQKKEEVARQKQLIPASQLETALFFATQALSLRQFLTHSSKVGIIAEFKRRSPSKGMINEKAVVEEVTQGYNLAGASGLSILTDESFLGGSNENLIKARRVNFVPILRKEFIIDPYQVLEAKSIGADVVLLIAECLTKDSVKELAKMAKSIGLEVLLEVHSADQLEKCNEYIDIVGVNNRNLKNFTVDIQTSVHLFDLISNDFVKISESGISDPNTIVYLKQVGFQGFLIGEHFMADPKPHQRCEKFINTIRELMENDQ